MSTTHRRTAKTLAIAISTIGAWGCDGADGELDTSGVATADGDQTERSSSIDGEGPPRVAPPATSREIDVETGRGAKRISVTEIDGKLIFEGDIEIPNKPLGAAVFGKRWQAKTIPYVVAAGFPHPARISEAIAHWEQHTALRFVQRTTQSDYVRFVAGRGCSAVVGRVGGMQNVTLQAGENIKSVVGADFAPSNSSAHFWFKDGLYTAGKSWNVDETSLPASYTLPNGRTTADVRDMAFAANGDVYAWYLDGTVSVGTPSNLGAKLAPRAFTMPANKTPSSIVGVSFVLSGHVRAWYADGTTSEGTAYDLGAYAAPIAYVAASGQATSELLAVGVAGSNVYTWYRNKQASGGTVTNLAATYAPYDVTTPGHCGTPEAIHEIGHAVGFQHEQTRLDRDQFITIQWSNITNANAYNFQKHDSGSQDHGAYDYLSVMHYGSYAFSSNGQATILRKNGGLIIDATVLSAGDISSVASMYP